MQTINLTLHREILEEIEGENVDFPCANRNNLIFVSCAKKKKKNRGRNIALPPPPYSHTPYNMLNGRSLSAEWSVFQLYT